jgi:hypothetical protein
MRRIERVAIATAMAADGRVATSASTMIMRSSSILSVVLPTSAVVAILGVLLLLIRPVAPSTSGAAGLAKTLETHAALGA